MKEALQVLLVEDNPNDAELVLHELRRAEYEPEWTRVENEREYLVSLRPDFDIILSDYAMPQFSGFRALELLNQSALDIPFILVSGTIGEDIAVAAMQRGAMDYILKDRLARLGHAVSHALEQSRLRQERKYTERALKDSEERFRKLFEDNLTGNYIIGEDGRMIACNPSFAHIFGFHSVAEAMDCNFEAVFESRQECQRFMDDVRKLKRLTYHELKFRRRDGKPIHAVQNAIGSFDALGGLTEIKGYVFDNTDRHKLEEQLRQSQKMEAIGQLAGGVAHDFNNQLNAIMGYADLLKSMLTEPQHLRFAENICNAALRSADLTTKLLAFARKRPFQSAPVDIHKIVLETVEMLQHSIDKRIKLHQALAAESSVIAGDPSQLQNAMLNLALNARDAMPNGGTLGFVTQTILLDSVFCAAHNHEVAPGCYLKISVSDSGTGMTPEVRKRIFEPFFTTKAPGKGTGMGLASVFGTVKSHSGVIDVYSEVGHGTTFNLYLPLSEQNITPASISGTHASISGKLRILLVEDEEVLRTLFADMIAASSEHTLFQAENGQLGLEFYRRNWKSVDLVILDMVLPEMSGPDMFRAMKQINPEIKAILASGFSLNSEIQAALDSGVLGFIQKPFMLQQLMDAIAKVTQ